MPTRANGKAIRLLRERRGLTCAQLARELGYNEAFIWKIENAVQGGSPESRNKIAAFFGVPLEQIIEFVPKKPRAKRSTAEKQAA